MAGDLVTYYTTDLIEKCYHQLDLVLSNYHKDMPYQGELKDLKTSLAEFNKLKLNLLSDHNDRKAFWINVYNLYIKYLIAKLGIRKSVLDKPWIFILPKIHVGGMGFSLDDIEHGILRANSPSKFSLAPQFWPWDTRRSHICTPLDYRIHFALNCAAASCPPVRIYDPKTIDLELDKAEYNFAFTNFLVNTEQREITCSPLFAWYRRDFAEVYLNSPDYKGYKVKFSRYDWSLVF